MSKGTLFIVLPESSVANVQRAVREYSVPDARKFVQVLSDASAATLTTDVKSQTTRALIDRISAHPRHQDNKLIVGREAQCSIAELSEWWKADTFGDPYVRKLAPKAVTQFVKEHLETTGAHWRVHAQAQLKEFDGRKCLLDAWMQQFGELGCTGIGRKIAAKLRVIRTGELPGGAFAMRTVDVIGNRQGCCYIEDGDAGGSWLEMQAILTHACPDGTVFSVRWNKGERRLHFPDAQVDEFVVYEDGLWSGSEAVRRLQAIKEEPPPARVIFRFGVVTDFGLLVARQAIRSLNLGDRVSIDASASELIRFLKPDIPEELRLGLRMSPKDYFKALHQYVEPFAFSVTEDWTSEEIRICEEIGTQLVSRWLSQHSADQPMTEKVGRFALGGGRFASTVVFSRSVPKVCLPLLWLDGPVSLQGKSVSWKPLFIDARRVSDDSLLFS